MWFLFFLLLVSPVMAESTYEKKDDMRLAETKQVEETYSIKDLKQEKVELEARLDKINALLNEAKKLGIE